MDNLVPTETIKVIVDLIADLAKTGRLTLANIVTNLIKSLSINRDDVIPKIVETMSDLIQADLGNLRNASVVKILGNILEHAISTLHRNLNSSLDILEAVEENLSSFMNAPQENFQSLYSTVDNFVNIPIELINKVLDTLENLMEVLGKRYSHLTRIIRKQLRNLKLDKILSTLNEQSNQVKSLRQSLEKTINDSKTELNSLTLADPCNDNNKVLYNQIELYELQLKNVVFANDILNSIVQSLESINSRITSIHNHHIIKT